MQYESALLNFLFVHLFMDQDCQICYRIICRGCGWTAGDEDVRCIQRGEMTACPECGWMPK